MTINSSNLQKDCNLLEAILARIENYRNKKIDIATLINSLDDFLNQLTTIDEEWKNEFRSLWLDIEVVHAVSLDTDDLVKPFTDNDYDIIAAALHNLQKITQEKLAEKRDLSKPIFEIEYTAMSLVDHWLECPICQEAWETTSREAMICCPQCRSILHNPHFEPHE